LIKSSKVRVCGIRKLKEYAPISNTVVAINAAIKDVSSSLKCFWKNENIAKVITTRKAILNEVSAIFKLISLPIVNTVCIV
jgi:hypothetical protein